MGIRCPLYIVLIHLTAAVIIHCDHSRAKILDEFDGDISKLTTWQDEDTGPFVLPNHQFERKAERSPSLRLRFGRRADRADKSLHWSFQRWLGDDGHHKPIRSPAVRLRFGRRSETPMTAAYLSHTLQAINANHPFITNPSTAHARYNPISKSYNHNPISNANNHMTIGFVPIDQNSFFEKYQTPIDSTHSRQHNKIAINELDNEKFRDIVLLRNELETRNYKHNDKQMNGGWFTENDH